MSSEAGGAADAGAGGAGGGAAGTDAGAGAAAPPAAFYEGFASAELKTNPTIHKFKDAEGLAGAYVALEKRYGIDPARRIDLPADPNDAEGMRAVYTRLGLPEKPEGYGFKAPDGASDVEKQVMDLAAGEFHKLGLPASQAKGVVDWWQGLQAQAAQAAQEADTARIAEGKAALAKDFGQANDTRIREVRALVEKEFGSELADAMKDDGIYRYPNLIKGLAKVVERMAEPGALDGGSGDHAQPGRPMTPAQAQAAVRALSADPVKGKALMDSTHPQHAAVVAERRKLLAWADGRETA